MKKVKYDCTIKFRHLSQMFNPNTLKRHRFYFNQHIIASRNSNVFRKTIFFNTIKINLIEASSYLERLPVVTRI